MSKEKQMNSVLTQLNIPIIITILLAFLSYYLAKKRELQIKASERMKKPYEHFMKTMINSFAGKTDKLENDMTTFARDLIYMDRLKAY